MKKVVSIFCLTVLFFSCGGAFALEYSADLSLGSEYESNATLGSSVNQDIQDDVSSTAELSVNASQETQRLAISADYRLAYTNYDKASNEDRSEFTGSADLSATLVKQRLFWDASHNSSETVSDRSLSDTADNRQRRQQFATGPLLILPLTGVDQAVMQANYTEVQFRDAENTAASSDADSQSYSASLNWSRQLSPLTRLITGVSYQEVERDQGNLKTEIQTYHTGFTRALRSLQYSLQIGGNRIEREGRNSNNGLFFQASTEYSAGGQTFSLTASQQQTDSSIGIRDFLNTIPDSGATASGSDLAFENFSVSNTVEITTFDLGYSSTLLCQRCNARLGYSFIESDYEDDLNLSDQDDRVSRFNVEFGYRINRRLSANIAGRYEHIDFLDIGAADEETEGSLYLQWSATRQLNIRLGGGYEQRDGGDNPNYYNSYGSLRLTYNLLSSN